MQCVAASEAFLEGLTYLVDDLHLDFLLVGDGFLFADFLCFHTNHLDQLVCVFILLLELCLLNCQLGFQVIHLREKKPEAGGGAAARLHCLPWGTEVSSHGPCRAAGLGGDSL